jgi:hypothetical protein
MMTSRTSACRSMSRFQMINGSPATGRSGFGTVLVIGRSRVPSPAAKIIARMWTREA